jgi:MFS family permease
MAIKLPSVKGPLSSIIAEGFLSRLSFGILSFGVPIYARHLGLSLSEIGLLLSLHPIAEQSLKPVAGWAADRFGLKRSFVVAIAMRSLVALLLVFASRPWELYAIRVLHGMSESLRDPSVNALIAESGSPQTIASSFAWYATAKTVAGSLGKTAAGFLLTLTAYSFPKVFAVAFILSSLPLYVVARYVREPRGRDEVVGGEPQTQEEPLAVEPGATATAPRKSVLPFVALGFLIAGTANMLQNLFPILAIEYGGLTEAETGVIYAMTIPLVIISGPMFGWLSDNISRRLVLLARGIFNILSSIIYITFPGFAGIATGKLADDLGKSAFRPAWGELMSTVSGLDRRRRARTIGYLGFGEGLGEIAGPLLAGVLWGVWGIPVVMAVRVLLALASEVYAVALLKPIENR